MKIKVVLIILLIAISIYYVQIGTADGLQESPQTVASKELKINDRMISIFNFAVAVLGITILVASGFFVYKSFDFRKDAERELDRIEKTRERVERVQKELADSKKETLKEVEEEINSIIDKIKPDVKSELKEHLQKKLHEAEEKCIAEIESRTLKHEDINEFKAHFHRKLQELKEECCDKIESRIQKIEKELIDLVKRGGEFQEALPVDGVAKGNAEIDERNFDLAEIYFKKELFMNPEQSNVWVGLARTYAGKEQYDYALNSINTAIKLERKNPAFNSHGQISVIKAEILMKLTKFMEAKDTLEKDVLVKNPNFLKAQRLLEECDKKISPEG